MSCRRARGQVHARVRTAARWCCSSSGPLSTTRLNRARCATNPSWKRPRWRFASRSEENTLPTDDTSVVCPALGYLRSADVSLAAPLAGRTVIVLGQARGVFDGSTLAEPDWLPDGWLQTSEHPSLLEQDLMWTRAWTPALPPADESVCPEGPGGLALLEGPSEAIDRSLSPDEQQSIGTHDINGMTATAAIETNRNITWLTWSVGDRSYRLSSAPACDGDQPIARHHVAVRTVVEHPVSTTGRSRRRVPMCRSVSPRSARSALIAE